MNNLIDDLNKAMISKALSPEQAAGFIGCTGIQIRRWLRGESKPGPIYRKAILEGIKKIKQSAV